MKNLKGTKTEQNLKDAFRGESEARNKYTYFSSKAKKDGFVQISKIFEETSNNEKEHAKIWFKLISEIGCTDDNLSESVKSERYESEEMYPKFAKEARDEGFPDIAQLFENVSKVEAEHAKRYEKLLDNIKNNRVYISEEKDEWICLNCGYIYKGTKAPDKCPVCSHSKDYFAKHRVDY